MIIIADENIPCVEKAFASLGEVVLLPGRDMQPEQVRDADVLLVRSVTRVDRNLLAGSRIRFVASATIGFDHVDREYLSQSSIGFAMAPGSNATSAAEYVVSALLVLAERKGVVLAGKTVGIVGCGNVGSRVREKLSALGMVCKINDPPLQAAGVQDDYIGLDEVLQSDIVTLHVPFTRTGPCPTAHLLGAAALRRLQPGAWLVNTARGSVVDNRALTSSLAERDDLSVVLDVWEGEPSIDTGLLTQVDLGTAHIAGYSLDGKLRGTEMIYRAACEYFKQPVCWRALQDLPASKAVDLGDSGNSAALLNAAVFNSYDVRADDARLRTLLTLPPGARAVAFDKLRKDYPLRREFSESGLSFSHVGNEASRLLRRLGFPVNERTGADLPG